MHRPIIVVHGGAGAKSELSDGTDVAADAGYKILHKGGSALDAVEAAVKVLEDDWRFNAGTGSYMALDGHIEMDASIMDDEGNIGAVAAISRVRHPISIARKVMDLPHVLLVGEGAVQFARKCGFEDYDPTTEKAIKRLAAVKEKLAKKEFPPWSKKWNAIGCDTVGAVACDAKGRFAAANSTGGTSWKMYGRVGDTPIIGAGIFCGKDGAVVATGIGEEIIRKVLCKEIYNRIGTMGVQQACEWGIALYPKTVAIGVIAVGRGGWGRACNRDMATSVRE